MIFLSVRTDFKYEVQWIVPTPKTYGADLLNVEPGGATKMDDPMKGRVYYLSR